MAAEECDMLVDDLRDEVHAPDLEDTPYRYHYYIASCPEDASIRRTIIQELEKSGFDAFPEDENEDSDLDTEAGVLKSKKVVFLITNNYLKYPWRTLQINLSKEKANCVTEDDVIVLQAADVSRQHIKELRLENYRHIVFKNITDVLYELEMIIQDDGVQGLRLRSNLGASMAVAHYYGYLRLILPGLADKIRGTEMSLSMPTKLIVVIPESLKGPESLDALDDRITDTEKQIKIEGTRAGKLRDYSCHLYSIKNSESYPKEFTFAGEVPAALLNIFDMEKDSLVSQSHYSNFKSWCIRQFYYHLKYLLDQDPDCKGKVAFIFYADVSSDSREQIGDIILDRVRRETQNEMTASANSGQTNTDPDHADGQPLKRQKCSFTEKHCPLALKWCRPSEYYTMDEKPVGKALVINNTFDRRGSEYDEDVMKALLEWLDFEVVVKRDQTAEQMQELANEYANDVYHSDSQAFVFVIMTHGVCGKLKGNDNELVNFVDMADCFRGCKTLRGKPKIFFVQSCQTPAKKTEFDITGMVQRLTPSLPDCLASFASIPGSEAYRDPNSGSVYIQSLCRQIWANYNSMPLTDILDEVERDVRTVVGCDKKELTDIERLQFPFYTKSLFRKVILKQNKRCNAKN